MRKFLLAFLLLALGSVLLFELDPSLKYEIDSDNYRWIGKTIFDPNIEVGTAFVGTSRTWTAVNTMLIDQQHPEDHAYNFGANWHGRQARYVVIRDLLEQKQVKRLVLEINHFEEQDLHGYSRFLGGFLDVPIDPLRELPWDALLRLRQPFKAALSDFVAYYAGAAVRSYYLWYRRLALTSFRDWSHPNFDLAHGHLGVPTTDEEHRRFLESVGNHVPAYVPANDQDEQIRERYLRKISELCQAKGVQLYFLFLPGWNGPLPGPHYREVLSHYGTIIDLPFDGLYEPDLWRDLNHFNIKGGRIFTERLMAILDPPAPSP